MLAFLELAIIIVQYYDCVKYCGENSAIDRIIVYLCCYSYFFF